MMTRDEVKTATREQLADELAAANQATEGWQTMPIDQLRADVLTVVGEYAADTNPSGTSSYAVMVRTTVGTWTTHSTFETRSEAQDQADYVGGRVVKVDEDGKEEAD